MRFFRPHLYTLIGADNNPIARIAFKFHQPGENCIICGFSGGDKMRNHPSPALGTRDLGRCIVEITFYLGSPFSTKNLQQFDQLLFIIHHLQAESPDVGN